MLKLIALIIATMIPIYLIVTSNAVCKRIERLNNNPKILRTAIVVVMCMLTIVLEGVVYRSSLVSWLSPPITTVSAIQSPDFNDESRIINFTTGAGAWSYAVYELENSRIKACNCEPIPLQIYVDNRKWYLDVSLFAGKGLTPARIEYNKWTVKPPNWDMNFADGAFEVINDKQEPVFQLIFRTKDKAVINGFFPLQDTVFITSEFGIGLLDEIEEYKFTRIFKYPSSKYLGQLK